MKRSLSPFVLILLAGLSCSKKVTQAGGLELLLMSDLPASDLNKVHLEVSQETAPGEWHKVFDRDAFVHDPQEISLPTTASIAAGESPNQGALIVFSGLRGGEVVVQRVVQTQVPTDRIAELKMLLAESCVGKVTDCSAGASCQPNNGMCGTNVVDSSMLPTYVPGDESKDGGGSSGTDGGPAGPEIEPPLTCPLGQSRRLALTNPEYDRTVRDLLGDTSSPSIAAQFSEDAMDAYQVVPSTPGIAVYGFRRDLAGSDAAWAQRMSQYARAADLVVENARRNGQIPPCPAGSANEAVFADRFIAEFGLRAFRRPLTVEEKAGLVAAYSSGKDCDTGISEVVRSALASSHFLMIEEGGTPGSATLLGDYAMASRLSYFLYRSMPDQELFDAAAAGKLHTKSEVAAQAGRMLANPKAHDAVIDFFSEWLTLDRLTGSKWSPGDNGITKIPAVSPDFDTVKGYMRAETAKFGEMVFFGDGRLTTVLTGTKTFLNEPLAAIYGVPGITGIDWRLASLDATRAGILTQASILSLTGNADESSPTKRGLFVVQKLLCQALPPPPPGVRPLPPVMPGIANRQRYESHRSEASCAPCHSVMDPVGLGFENYDAIGRYRTMENGLPIDASGSVGPLNPGPFNFNGAVELAPTLALANEVRDCVATQWFRFALSRREDMESQGAVPLPEPGPGPAVAPPGGDTCALTPVQEAFRKSDNLQDLVVSIATSPSFRYARW